MTKIYVKGNFLIYTNESNLFFADNVENILLSKNSTSSTSYYLYMRGINKLINDIAFADISDENGNAYSTQAYFENYIYTYTGNRVSLPLVSIGELNDVAISAPSNGQVLEYNATSGQWENVSPSALGGDMTQAVYDVDGDGVVDSSEKLEFIGKNSTGVTIAKNKVVYISGATGQKPNITLADASLEITSSKTIGITRTSIANNSDGYVITHGTIHDIDTSAFADGNALWLSETAGEITNVVPSEPAHAVFIGYVAYAHPTAGRIILHIQNGYELNELHGVSVSSEVNNDVLRYESSTGLWKNQQIETASSSQKGLLSSTDWTTFNNKQDLLGFTPENVANKSTDLTASATKYPTVDAVNTGLGLKENTITAGTTSQYYRGDKTFQTLDKTAVGLGNCDNTSDADKPISSATQTALNAKQDTLVSGTNIKTINSSSVLGSGDILVQSPITLTTTGTTGLSTLIGSTLNIPDYSSSVANDLFKFSANEFFRGITINNNSTTVTSEGGVTMSTSASTLAQSVSSTAFNLKNIRLRYYASTVSTGRYTGTRGSALLWYLGGGFRFVCSFAPSDSAYGSGCRQFYGMAGSTADLTYTNTVLVASLQNIIGVGSDALDDNLQIFTNDTTGTATKIDLGANFPANRTAGSAITTIYQVQIYNPAGSSSVHYKVNNLETGDSTEGTLTTDLPSLTQGLNFFASRCMGTPVTNTGEFYLYNKLGVYSVA